jgi:hypothetical protein
VCCSMLHNAEETIQLFDVSLSYAGLTAWRISWAAWETG